MSTIADILDAFRAAPFLLAPLAGVSDSAFRQVCFSMGAGAACTEMISTKGLKYGSPKTEELLYVDASEGPVGVQLFGSDPADFEAAIALLSDRPFAFIDINMGCPVPKVVKNGEGAALLKDPERAAAIVRACVSAAAAAGKARGEAPKPVTVKMRVGFSKTPADGEIGCKRFAARMEEAGASAIAVHGRTREQYYSGRADREAIARVRRAVTVPVIANGDVFSAEDGLRLMEETGADAVMVARGAMGDPWIFRELSAAFAGRPVPPRPTAEEIVAVIRRQLALAASLKGEYAAIREMRKHISWYTKGLRGAAALREKINGITDYGGLTDAIESIKEYRSE